jgi:dephospho-CoA kinase
MEPGQTAHEEILQEFGMEIADSGGRIDRAKLASIVFPDPRKLAKLNQIIHPRVEQIVFRQFADWQQDRVRDAGFVEAALLVEAGIADKLDGLVVAYCAPEQQMERLLARGMSKIEATRRMAAQMPVEEKLQHATERIDCSGTLPETRAQVRALAAKLRQKAAG